ncbi:MAG: cysteine--tRNA ligase [Gammaproteobacteria bacterium]
MLTIYNSITRKKERFKPLEAGKVRMYVCGLTVYDYSHLGHARAMVIFDMVVHYLRARGYDVTYVRNITDIDDKIINRANENKEDISELTARFIKAMHEDTAALGVEMPDAEPRATQHIDQIINMINKLMENGYAYAADNGDVYYDVSRFPSYGKLSGKRLEELRAGARVAVEEAKDDPLDFVLWKAAKPNEPSWESPWGPGRPGWHIECSAMSTHCLGNHFDIHGGGQDLQFPHHENEIAQSEGATGKPFVNVWMHNGFVRVDDEKMSKSLGNFFTVREVLAKYHPEEVRYFILSSHYRSPLNYSKEHLDGAKAALTRFYTALRGLPNMHDEGEDAHADGFFAAMDDDFNTPEAIAVLFDLAHEINRVRERDPAKAGQLARMLRRLGEILGLLQDDPEAFLKRAEAGADQSILVEMIEQLIVQRDEARKHKAWAESDRIRALLAEKGIVLEDAASGTTWRRS